MRIIAIFIGFLLLSGSAAGAQGTPEIASRLRAEYENCVYDAVGVQWKENFRLNPNVGTEVAFQVCQTEEQAIAGLLYAINVAPSQVNLTILDIKMHLKRNVRAIMADPAKYKKDHGG